MNPDIQPYELSAMRQAADKAPFDVQRLFHALLDAYEDTEKSAEAAEAQDALASKVKDAISELRKAFPDEPASVRQCRARDEFGEPLSEDAWHEKLEACRTPEEILATVANELERARAAEDNLRTRVKELEDAIESALSELED